MATPAGSDELPDDTTGDMSDATGEDLSDEDALAPEDTDAINRMLARRPVVAAPTQRGPAVPDFLMGNPVTRFMAESYLELRKVTAPTAREAWNMTLIVIIFSAVVALILGVADLALLRGLTWIISGH
ncbi:MAG: preprotein translocase subunit SecE [Ktedonobacterales bacterium]|jgi:preprotein translocase SecE subunit